MTVEAPFNPSFGDLRPFAAEAWLVAGIAGNLLVPFATRRPNFICAAVSLAVLVLAISSLFSMQGAVDLFGSHLRGMLVFDSTALVGKLILLTFISGVVVLWMGHTGRVLREGDAPEFFVLLLGSTLGMCLMTSTTNLLMIFMSVAMASLPSYLLAGFRKNSRRAAEAALKYVLFGAVAGAIMIYGMSFLYGLYGSLQLEAMPNQAPAAGTAAAVSLALIGLLIGVGFKISAVPFHFWCPDVFEGSSIEVTTFLSVASKGAALILLLRILERFGSTGAGIVVGVLGLLTATVGNTAAFKQSNMKRLLAYSSIAQAGYMMCLVSATGRFGNALDASIEQGLLFYLVVYAVMNLGAFAITAVVIRLNGDRIENFAGLGRSSPFIAGAMFCCLVSLIGLPPFAGFGAKVNVMWVLSQSGAFGIVLVAGIVLNTVLSAFYYFRIVRVMYLQPAADGSRVHRVWSGDPIGLLLGAICASGLIALFFGFGLLHSVIGQPALPNIKPVSATAVDSRPVKAIEKS